MLEEAQLSAHNLSFSITPLIIAYFHPVTSLTYFNYAFFVVPTIHKSNVIICTVLYSLYHNNYYDNTLASSLLLCMLFRLSLFIHMTLCYYMLKCGRIETSVDTQLTVTTIVNVPLYLDISHKVVHRLHCTNVLQFHSLCTRSTCPHLHYTSIHYDLVKQTLRLSCLRNKFLPKHLHMKYVTISLV